MTNLAYNDSESARRLAHLLDVAIPVGFWRAPYANSNTFATESFIDELAHAAAKDPVAFRLAMLERRVRRRVTCSNAPRSSRTGAPPAAGSGTRTDVAMGQWDDGWIAMIGAEISMPDGKLKVHKLTSRRSTSASRSTSTASNSKSQAR